MRNHDQKSRDMARSILPSTARKSAREAKKTSTRRARARTTARLHRLMNHVGDLDGFEEPLDSYDLDEFGYDTMIDQRRDADKIAPITRWAEARIEHDPHLRDGDYWTRRHHFASLLGNTLSGRHALQHLDHLFGEQNPWEWGYPGRPTWAEARASERAAARVEHDARAQMLDEVLAGADAHRLNTRITALTPEGEERWSHSWPDGDVRTWVTLKPWLYDGHREKWLNVAHRTSFGTTVNLIDPAQAIAFTALTEVHAEMFGR